MAFNNFKNRNVYFGQRLKELRENSNLTQVELATNLGIAAKNGSQTVSNWETYRREPSFNMLCKIAEFFETTTDYMLGSSLSPLESDEEVLTVKITCCLKNNNLNGGNERKIEIDLSGSNEGKVELVNEI